MKRLLIPLTILIAVGSLGWFVYQNLAQERQTYTHPRGLFSFEYPNTVQLQVDGDEVRLKPQHDSKRVVPAGANDVLVSITTLDGSVEEVQKRWGDSTQFTSVQFQGKPAFFANLTGMEYGTKILIVDLGSKRVEIQARSGMLDGGYFIESLRISN
jgi:hypothetical protein